MIREDVKRSELYASRRYSGGIDMRVIAVSEGDASKNNVRSVESDVEGSISTWVESRKRTRNSGLSGFRWCTISWNGRESLDAFSSCSITERRTSKNVISGTRSSLRSKGRAVACAEMQMTSDGSGVYRKRRMVKDVRRRWYGVGSGDAGKREENSSVRRRMVGVSEGGMDMVWNDSTSFAGAKT